MSTTPLVKYTAAVKTLIEKAHTAGVTEDQLRNFIKYGYVPLPWTLKFHAAARLADQDNGPVDVGLGGARGPGKSHATFAQVALDDCQRHNNLKVLFLRQTGKSAQESFQDLVDNVIAHKVSYEYNISKGLLSFPNRSKIILGGFETDQDIDKYVGIQYDVIVIEERNQLTGEKIMKLKGSLRTTKIKWRARMYSSFNPGNIGHADIKQTFVEPQRMGKETKTRFFPGTYKDNPFLKPEYIEYLNSLPGALGKAWRDGNFDTFEGQYFLVWDNSVHTINPIPVPESYKKFRAYDHGRENPACCKWYYLDYDGRAVAYRELYVKGWNVDDIAKKIVQLSAGETYEYSVADPAIFAKTGMVDSYGGQTIAESFARRGVTFIPASNRRVDGWNIMQQYLAYTKDQKPRLQYFNTCYDSIRTIPTLIHDEHRPEDVETKGEDHAADVDRYFLTSLHERKTAAPKTEVERKLDILKQKHGYAPMTPSVLDDFYQGDLYRRSM